MTLYCKLNRDERCPSRFPFNFSSWNPGNCRNFSGPCRNTRSFQSSYFLTTSDGSLLQFFSMSRCSLMCHIISNNKLSFLISQAGEIMGRPYLPTPSRQSIMRHAMTLFRYEMFFLLSNYNCVQTILKLNLLSCIFP